MNASDAGERARADLDGSPDQPIEIVAYDERWPVRYEAERGRIAPLLVGAEIHHIGSTAVPGLAAKNVIDMIALVGDLDEPIQPLCAEAGYQYPVAYNEGLRGRRFLCHPSPQRREHHLHLVVDRAELDLRVGFRDRLRADRALAGRYAELKHDLATRHREDREAYTQAKERFILDALGA